MATSSRNWLRSFSDWFIRISQWFSVWGYSITVGVIENSYILAMFVTMEIYVH